MLLFSSRQMALNNRCTFSDWAIAAISLSTSYSPASNEGQNSVSSIYAALWTRADFFFIFAYIKPMRREDQVCMVRQASFGPLWVDGLNGVCLWVALATRMYTLHSWTDSLHFSWETRMHSHPHPHALTHTHTHPWNSFWADALIWKTLGHSWPLSFWPQQKKSLNATLAQRWKQKSFIGIAQDISTTFRKNSNLEKSRKIIIFFLVI